MSQSKSKHPITVAYGDGIGPEIMKATLFVLEEAGARLTIEEAQIGEKIYLSGHPTGIEDSAFESLRRTKVFLKAPITTPFGGGFKSLNVTVRTAFGLFANIRPCLSYHPFVPTLHPQMDVIVIRENEEDLYCGIEYRQTPDVCTAKKLISRPGSEKIIRYAFEYAQQMGRKKVTCLAKDNILKITDGLFHHLFLEIAKDYPHLEHEYKIVDIGMAKIADKPQHFDVIVTPNLYGDILSDITAEISGSVGLVGTANIGEQGAMFEAIHGSAPHMAGSNSANPSGLILASVLMLVHIHQLDVASAIHNAFLCTLEEGLHTKDIFHKNISQALVGTQEFAQAIVKRLGKKPKQLKPACYAHGLSPKTHFPTTPVSTIRGLHGVDISCYYHGSVESLVALFEGLPLTLITNRGTEVYPKTHPETFCVDQWRCRLFWPDCISYHEIIKVLTRLNQRGVDIIGTENLYHFDGKPAYSHAHAR